MQNSMYTITVILKHKHTWGKKLKVYTVNSNLLFGKIVGDSVTRISQHSLYAVSP